LQGKGTCLSVQILPPLQVLNDNDPLEYKNMLCIHVRTRVGGLELSPRLSIIHDEEGVKGLQIKHEGLSRLMMNHPFCHWLA
jgi:hypothetical protein